MAWEPLSFAKPNPSPKETPLTAGTEKIKCDKMLSTESKKGSPSPVGRPIMAVSKIPPNESPSAAAFSISWIIWSLTWLSKTANVLSLTSWICFSKTRESWLKGISDSVYKLSMCDPITMPCDFRICRQILPAATMHAVSLPEKCPPPR